MKTLFRLVLVMVLGVSCLIPATASAYYYGGRYYRYRYRGHYYSYRYHGYYYRHRRWVVVAGRPGYYRYW